MNTLEFLDEMERRAKSSCTFFLTLDEEVRLYTETGIAVPAQRVKKSDYWSLCALPSDVLRAVEEGRAILNERVVKRLTS